MAAMRSDEFDPYYKWLGIPRNQRPPTHYQLLGVDPTEAERDVIEAAAERQRSHVQRFRGTEYEKPAAKLLYEIGEAETCLLDPQLRMDYDRLLRESTRKTRKRILSFGKPPAIHSGGPPELVPTFLKIVGILLAAMIIMAGFSFMLPWDEVAFKTAGTPPVRSDPPQIGAPPNPIPQERQVAQGRAQAAPRPGNQTEPEPQPTDAGDVDLSETITAKVVSVDAGSRSLTVSYNGRSTEFDVSRAAVLLAEDAEITLDDLSSGLSATITFNPEYDVVTRLELRAPPRAEEVSASTSTSDAESSDEETAVIEAVVSDIDVDGRVLSVTRKGKSTIFDVSRKALVTQDGRQSSLSELSVGQKALITFNIEFNVITQIEVLGGEQETQLIKGGPDSFQGERESESAPEGASSSDDDNLATVEAKITSFSVEERSLTVTRNGRETTFDVSRRVTIERDGKPASPDDLAIGQTVSITFDVEFEVVTRIEIVTAPAARDSSTSLNSRRQNEAGGNPPLTNSTFAYWKEFLEASDDELSYLGIDWGISLQQAVREAADVDKPVMLWAMNGCPLRGCT